MYREVGTISFDQPYLITQHTKTTCHRQIVFVFYFIRFVPAQILISTTNPCFVLFEYLVNSGELLLTYLELNGLTIYRLV